MSRNGEREPAGPIWKHLPAARKDELDRLAMMLDGERSTNNMLCAYRDEATERVRLAYAETERVRGEKFILWCKMGELKSTVRKEKRRATMARRKALQDVCDVLNYARRKKLC